MKIVKAYKYKLKTNKDIEEKFRQIAGCCWFVYNLFLAQKIQEYRTDFVTPNYYDQAIQLPLLKEEYPWLKEAHSQVLQQALKDLEQAFKNFFRRVKSGGVPGFPKFRKKGVHDSFRYPQGIKIEGSRIYLPKAGWVSFHKSRSIQGEIKNVTVSESASGWYVSIQTEQDVPDIVHSSNTAVGVDVGVRVFAALCHNCGYTSKENRKTQAHFHCTVFGYELNADINAAKNILAVGLTVSACGAAALAAQ